MTMQAAMAQRGVMTFDRESFAAACTQLMDMVCGQGKPQMIVGIPTGGMHVAEAMSDAASWLPIFPLTCRRPSTRHKRAHGLKTLVRGLPRPLLDRLRLIEHAVLTRQPKAPAEARFLIDEAELEMLRDAVMAAGPRPSILVVDDAVDTGTTLSVVMDAVRRHAPDGAKIRSAAITVTTDRPLISPDYVLHHRQLCRFPWSLDAMTASQS
jgi:hypoxanthine phosphoribosyltransferase